MINCKLDDIDEQQHSPDDDEKSYNDNSLKIIEQPSAPEKSCSDKAFKKSSVETLHLQKGIIDSLVSDNENGATNDSKKYCSDNSLKVKNCSDDMVEKSSEDASNHQNGNIDSLETDDSKESCKDNSLKIIEFNMPII